MANFIARVELHSASYEDYEKLHATMLKKGYSRTIRGGNGVLYNLPTGTYVVRDTNVTLDVALAAAVGAANEVGRTSSVVVFEWSQASWQGLPKAA